MQRRLRQRMLNQGLLAITFFKASAFIILLVLYQLLRRDFPERFLRTWLTGWVLFTCYAAGQVAFVMTGGLAGRLLRAGGSLLALGFFLVAVLEFVGRAPRWKLLGPLLMAAVSAAVLAESLTHGAGQSVTWVTSSIETALPMFAGWILWKHAGQRAGHGPRLLAGALLLDGLNNLDRPLWPLHHFLQLRVAAGDLFEVVLGVAMAVVILEAAQARTDELNGQLRKLSLITATSTQRLDLNRALTEVLQHLVESLKASHGMVRLLEGSGEEAGLVVRASVGFEKEFLQGHSRTPGSEPWVRRMLQENLPFVLSEQEDAVALRARMQEAKVAAVVQVPLPGKDSPLGILGMGWTTPRKIKEDELRYLINVANLLGLTIQNVSFFEQVSAAGKEWVSTFDSIDDPILVHDSQGRILRVNRKLAERLGCRPQQLVQRLLSEVLRREDDTWRHCPYCEDFLGHGDASDPNLGPGYFLASKDPFHSPDGQMRGTVHVLKDITERKRAEERYRNLIENVQEGVFISTPEGRFIDFNQAFLQLLGYESREELLRVDIAPTLYVNPADRERLQKMLRENGSVNNFEFQMRRRDGEILTVLESSFATRDNSGRIAAYQGFVLDITERKRAEQEIRRRNRELMVLNSIGQTLGQALDVGELLEQALGQVVDLFAVDVGSIYLLDEDSGVVRRVAAIGYRSEYAREFPPTLLPEDLLEQIRRAHATVVPSLSLTLPEVFQDLRRKEGLEVGHMVVLWAKDRMLGALVIGCRSPREYSAAELNLLNAVGTQIAAAVEKSLLLEETQKAYENLRLTQEQLLQSAKMAAVGQLISGVAHELNNPLTAILGYSQLLSAGYSGGSPAAEYVEKLYRQAQRTQRIVQNLLSFARQQKPERRPVNINQILEDSLSLREYDMRVNNIQLHRDLAPDLPPIAADAHQLQQVFFNILNNAADASLEGSDRGEIWIRTATERGHLIVEFTDSGPGVKDAARVFDPFYTTKPLGKGTGLGLSICYGIISEHDGAIAVRNVPPLGARFTVKLPLIRVGGAAQPARELSAEAPRASRILLVDDELTILDLEREILRGRYEWVRGVTTAEEAVRILERESVDLVVTDLKMPGQISGHDLYRWILRARPELANRVVFTMSDVSSGQTAGLPPENECPRIQKPFQLDSFLEVIQRSLDQPLAPAFKH